VPWPPWGAGLTRPIDGETECGDSYAAVQMGDVITAVMCDGLGHGPLAAAAAAEGVAAFLDDPDGDPAALLGRMHRRMGGTRGRVPPSSCTPTASAPAGRRPPCPGSRPGIRCSSPPCCSPRRASTATTPVSSY
jgi:hypothetical protein